MRVVICAFNEARLLPVCLGRLPKGTPVTVIDGAYRDYPHEFPWSTDGTCEFAEAWGADVVRVTEAWPDQIAKRTLSLSLDDVVFVLDADEVLLGPLPVLPRDSDVGWVTIHSPIYPEPYPEPRVFRVGDGWHYGGRHYWIYDADGRLVASHRAKGESYRHADLTCELLNARHWRRPSRLHDKTAYARLRNREEFRVPDEAALASDRPSPLRGLPSVRPLAGDILPVHP